MSLLRNVYTINKYNWGLALLEDLFTWVTLKKDRGVSYVGGRLLLF